MKKRNLLMGMVAACLLVACGGGNTSSVAPASSKAPASSSKAPASSSKTPSSSKASSTSKAPTDWTQVSKDGLVAKETKGEAVAYRVDVAEATGWNKSTTKMNGKTAPDNESKWDITGKIPAGTYAIELEGLMSYASHSDRYFYNQHETDTASQPDKATEDPFRYFFKVDGGAAINPDTKKTWGELGYQGSDESGTPVFAEIVSSFTLAADAKEFSLMHGNIGYSMIVSRIRLVAKK